MMSRTRDQSLLEALLDSWDRNNIILLNLLRALPEGGVDGRARLRSPRANAERQCQGGAQRGQEPGGARSGHEPPLRPPDPPASAHDLARGLPPRPDQAGSQGDGPSADGSGSWSSYVGCLDAQEVSRRLNFLRQVDYFNAG